MSIELMMPSNQLILYYPPLLLPSVFPSIRVFSSESALHIRWAEYWSFSFSISPSNEYSGLISFRIDWLGLLWRPRDSQVFSSTIVQKHQFFSTQPSLWSNSYIHTWLLEKTIALTMNFCWQSDVCFLIHCLGLSWLVFQGGSILWPHHILITSSEILSPNTAPWALGLQHMNLGGREHKHSDHNTILLPIVAKWIVIHSQVNEHLELP